MDKADVSVEDFAKSVDEENLVARCREARKLRKQIDGLSVQLTQCKARHHKLLQWAAHHGAEIEAIARRIVHAQRSKELAASTAQQLLDVLSELRTGEYE